MLYEMRQKGNIICTIFKNTYVISPLSLHIIYITFEKVFLISMNESREIIVQYSPRDIKRFCLLSWDLQIVRKSICFWRLFLWVLVSVISDLRRTELTSSSHPGFWLKPNFIISEFRAHWTPKELTGSPSMMILGTSNFHVIVALVCKNYKVHRNSLILDKLRRTALRHSILLA